MTPGYDLFEIAEVFTLLFIIENKPVGRAESIHQQRKWRYCFSNYTTGRVGDLPILQGFNRGSRPLFGSSRSA